MASHSTAVVVAAVELGTEAAAVSEDSSHDYAAGRAEYQQGKGVQARLLLA